MDETKKTLANPCVCMHVTSMKFDILKTSVLFDCEGRPTICYSSRGEAYLFFIIIVIVFFFIHFFAPHSFCCYCFMDRCVRIVPKFPCTFGQASLETHTAFAQVFTLKRYPKITSLRTQSAAARKIESSEL